MRLQRNTFPVAPAVPVPLDEIMSAAGPLMSAPLPWPPPDSPPATNVDQDADPGLFCYR